MFEDISNALKKISVKESFEDALSYVAPDIEIAQRAQLREGVYSTGVEISPPYTASTKQIKKRKGQPTNKVTLYDTGVFNKNIYVDVNDNGLEIGSKDSKENKLENKYGKDIFGLKEQTMSRQLDRVAALTVQLILEDINI